MVFTVIEENFSLIQKRLQALNQPSIIVYIERYFLLQKDQQAYCYISRYCNFGQQTTLSTEALHRTLKVYLMKGISIFFKLYEVIRTMLTNVNIAFEAEVDRQVTYIRLKYIDQPQLRWSTYDISYRGVDLLVGEKYIAIQYTVPIQG